MGIEFARPGLLWLLLSLIPLVALARARWGGPGLELSPGRVRMAVLLRCLIVTLLVLALAGLRQTLPADQLSVLFVVDRSLSTVEHEPFVRDFLEKARAGLGPHERMGIVTFASQAALELPASRPDQVRPFTAQLERGSSDLAGALRFASASFPAGSACRLVLLSDGHETHGNAVEEAELARQLGVEIWTVPLPASPGLEVLVESLQVPGRPAAGAPFEVSLTVVASHRTKATLRLRRNGRPVASEEVELEAGRNVFLVPQRATEAGVQGYTAQVEATGDRQAANNQAGGVAVVAGPPRLLYVAGTGHSPGPIPELLRERRLQVDVTDGRNLPLDLAAWQSYQAVIFDDVSALEVNPRQLEWLAALVRDAGMGFAMLGGPDSFGAGGYYESPLARALPVSLDIKRRKNTPLVALIMLIDKSGSMAEPEGKTDKLALAREAAIASVQLMSPQDAVGVIGFDSAAKWVVQLQKVEKPKAIAGQIATMRAGGGTNLYPALKMALDRLEGYDAPLKHVIALTDGQVEPGDYHGQCVRANRLKVTISSVAVGQGADTSFLATLAREGKGQAYLATSASMLPRILTRDTVLAARQAFVEKPFVPELSEAHSVLGNLLLEGVAPLLGCNLVTPGAAPARTLLVTPARDPVLAIGRYGLGKTLAWTSDTGRRWAGAWAARPAFADLMTQGARYILPESESAGLTLHLSPLGDGRVRVVAETASESMAPLEAGLLSPAGETARLGLTPVGPGRYEGEFTASDPGSWLVHLGDPESGGGLSRVFSLPYSPEHAAVGTNRALLERVAEAGGGRFEAAPQEVFAPLAEPPRLASEVWPALLLTAALLLLLDVAIRRVMLPAAWWRKLRPASAPAPVAESTGRLLERKRQIRPAPGSGTAAVVVLPPAPREEPPQPAPPLSPAEGGSMARLKKARDRARGKE